VRIGQVPATRIQKVVDVKRAADLIGEDIDVLAGTIGERNMWRLAALQRAAAYITERLESAGFTPAVQDYPVEGARVQNVEAALAGSTDTAPSVIIGAHYDTVIGCPGANDNATGVAAMLELARRFACQQHRRTVRFVAFANEEPPFFQTAAMGSLVYAKEAKRRGDRIVAMLSLETIGYYSDRPNSQQYPVAPLALFYPNTGNFIAFVSNIRSARLLRTAQRAFKARSSFPVQGAAVPAAIPGVGWSDHWSFWQVGYPAIMVTDTAPYRYPWYHTPGDTPDKVSLVHLADVVDGLEEVVHVAASG
jgi:Zn-dependent M28 family amino/carboxypeptidase